VDQDKSLAKRVLSFTEAVQHVEDVAPEAEVDSIVRATEMLVSGMTIAQVAKQLDIKKAVVLGWLQNTPGMVDAIRIGKSNLEDWRMALIQRQFALAANISQGILSLDMELLTLPPKLLAIIQKQANAVLDMGMKKNLEIREEEQEATLSAAVSALDYLASVIATNQAPVSEVRIIIPGEFTSEEVVEATIKDDQPTFGVFGSVDRTDKGFLCHICGEEAKNLHSHVTRSHHMKAATYEATYLLDTGKLKTCQI